MPGAAPHAAGTWQMEPQQVKICVLQQCKTSSSFISLMWQHSMSNQHHPLTQQVTVSRQSKSVPHFSKASQWLMATMQFSCFFFTNPSPVMHVFVVCVCALCAYKVYRCAHFIPFICMRLHTHTYNTTNTCITGNGIANYPYSTNIITFSNIIRTIWQSKSESYLCLMKIQQVLVKSLLTGTQHS